MDLNNLSNLAFLPDVNDPSGIQPVQQWNHQLNDNPVASDEDIVLSMPSTPMPAHQRANSTSVLSYGPVRTISGIIDRRNMIRARRTNSVSSSPRVTNEMLQAISFGQEVPRRGQQSSPQNMRPSIGPDYSQQLMDVNTPSSLAAQPGTSPANISMSQWDTSPVRANEPIFSSPDGSFFNMSTGQFEEPSNSLMAVNLDDSPTPSYINYRGADLNMDANYEGLGGGLMSIPTEVPINTASYSNNHPHCRTLSTNTLTSDDSAASFGSNTIFFEPSNTGVDDDPTSQLLTDIFGPEISANATNMYRQHPPQYISASESPESTMTGSPMSPQPPLNIPRRRARALQTPMHPTTRVRDSINASPTRAVSTEPHQSSYRRGLKFILPSSVAPAAPIKTKRVRVEGDSDGASPVTPTAKRACHNRRVSAPVATSAAMISSPSSTPSAASTPKKRKSRARPGARRRAPPVPYPRDWDSASGSDILLFELKNAGGTWAQIATTFNSVNGTHYTTSALQNRYHGIRRVIGNIPGAIPEEEMGLPACLEGYTIDADGFHPPVQEDQNKPFEGAEDENPSPEGF